MQEFTLKIKYIILSVLMMYAFVIKQMWAVEFLGLWYVMVCVVCVVQILVYFLSSYDIPMENVFLKDMFAVVALAGFVYFGHYLYAGAAAVVILFTGLVCKDWRR